MNTLIVQAKRPLQHWYPGRWVTDAPKVFYYLLIDGKRKEPTFKDNKIAEYIRNITVDDPNKIGRYDERLDSIIYTINLSEHGLVVRTVESIDNMFLISEEVKEETK
jgi:hypothetical protein